MKQKTGHLYFVDDIFGREQESVSVNEQHTGGSRENAGRLT